jgi:hypothetical protein
MKIRPTEAELFRAHGQTDTRTIMTKLIVAFRDFPKAPNNNYNFPTFGTIYDLAMATPIECAGQENGKPHLKLILLLVITLLLESISNLLVVLL